MRTGGLVRGWSPNLFGFYNVPATAIVHVINASLAVVSLGSATWPGTARPPGGSSRSRPPACRR